MKKMFAVYFFVIFISGCTGIKTQSNITAGSSQSYLLDEEFIAVYLPFLKADLKYMRSFSNKDKISLKTANDRLKPFADLGNPIAQLSYGGSKFLTNYKANASIFRTMLLKSSKSGYLPATRKLAMFYRSGQHFGKKPKLALKLLQANAQYGHESDIKTLLILYKKLPQFGKDSTKYKDLEKELELSKDSKYQNELAKQHDLKAQRVYGHMLYYGRGIKRDYKEAAYWLTIVSKNEANPQLAYDSARAIYARSKLSEAELQDFKNRISIYLGVQGNT